MSPLGKLGEAEVEVVLDKKKIRKDAEKLETDKGLAGKFGKVGKFLGGAMAAGITGGLAVVTGVAASVGALIGKYKDLNEELRPAANRIGIATAELDTLRKVAERLGSEDGLEGITDSAQELSLRLQDMTKDGYRADAALNQIGLSGDKLREMSPKDALLEVITALQGVEDQQKKNWLADELMGGQWENIAGILNVSVGEFEALVEVEGKHEAQLQKTLDQTQKLTEAQGKINKRFEDFKQKALLAILPNLVTFFEWLDKIITKGTEWYSTLKDQLSPQFDKSSEQLDIIWTHLKDVWAMIVELIQIITPYLIPVLQHFGKLMVWVGQHAIKSVIGILGVLRGTLMVIIGLLTGDFDKAWRGVALIVQSVVNTVVSAVNTLFKAIASGINALLETSAKGAEHIPFKGKALARKIRAGKMEFSGFPELDLTGGFQGPRRPPTAPNPSFGFSDVEGFSAAGAGAGGNTEIHLHDSIILDEAGFMEQVAKGKRLSDRTDTGER